MERNELFEIWDEGNKELFKNNKITKDMIIKYLDKKTLKTSRYFAFSIVFYMLIQFVNVVLSSMNIVVYSNNIIIVWVLIATLAIYSSILIYGIALFFYSCIPAFMHSRI